MFVAKTILSLSIRAQWLKQHGGILLSGDQHRLDRGRGLRRVVHIAADQEHVGLLLRGDAHHLPKHLLLLLAAVVVVEGVAQVPVAGV